LAKQQYLYTTFLDHNVAGIVCRQMLNGKREFVRGISCPEVIIYFSDYFRDSSTDAIYRESNRLSQAYTASRYLNYSL